MKLNDFNKQIKEEYESNLELKQKRIKTRPSKLSLVLIPVFAFAGLFIALVSSILINQAYVSNYNNNLKNSYDFDYESVDKIYKINNYAELKETYEKNQPKESWLDSLASLFSATSKGSNMEADFDTVTGINIDAGTASEDALPNGASQFQTNIQEQGVDESDIAKCDGTYIYYLYYDEFDPYLKVYDLSGNTIIEQKIEFNKPNENFEYSIYYPSFYEYENCKLYIRGKDIIIESYSAVLVYSFNNNSLELKYSSSFKRLVESRLIDNYYYFIGCISYSNIEANYDNLYYDGYSYYESIYRLYRFNLDNNDVESVDLADSYSSNYYMNLNYIAIATTIYYDSNTITAIKLFDVDLKPLGVYRVKGRLNDNFAIDIEDDLLRVVSTNVCQKKEKVNNLVIFDLKEEKRIGIIEQGLGEEFETVRSVTFDGDKCFVVTFFTTDPLYEIDLSDPTNPTIIDSYKAPGYSSYLKTFIVDNEKYVLGLGIIDFYNKISLYKDEDENVQIGEDYIITNNTYSMFYDYHAYFFYVSDAEKAIYFGTIRTYDKYTIYKIDVTTGDIIEYKNIDIAGQTRCFMINSVIYVPTRTKLVSENL